MTSQRFFPIISTLLWLLIPFITTKANSQPAQGEVIFQAPGVEKGQGCPKPALARLIRHKVAPGETLESIASNYNLIPATLMGINPQLQSGTISVGSEILIPPYNGIAVRVPAGKTLRDVAAIYNLRADVLFEINGCQPNPRVVFVPGVNWNPNSPETGSNREISGYPLPKIAPVELDYGWQLHPILGKVAFHSGVDLQVAPGTPVLATGDGTVAFVGKRGNYGNLVVINHQAGKQTRYAHLANINVSIGQQVRQGYQVGTVGSTGSPDTKATHLHFEVRHNSNLGWVAEDPKVYLQAVRTVRR